MVFHDQHRQRFDVIVSAAKDLYAGPSRVPRPEFLRCAHDDMIVEVVRLSGNNGRSCLFTFIASLQNGPSGLHHGIKMLERRLSIYDIEKDK
jgi:hypothetical protein